MHRNCVESALHVRILPTSHQFSARQNILVTVAWIHDHDMLDIDTGRRNPVLPFIYAEDTWNASAEKIHEALPHAITITAVDHLWMKPQRGDRPDELITVNTIP